MLDKFLIIEFQVMVINIFSNIFMTAYLPLHSFLSTKQNSFSFPSDRNSTFHKGIHSLQISPSIFFLMKNKFI
jgi:hypothetical protein